MNLKYTGALKDYSGYGEAGRNDVLALLSAGVGVTAEIPKYVLEIADFGATGQKCYDCENKPLDYRIKVLHVTPNTYPAFYEAGKYHIGRVIWETDKLPDDFARNAQMCDEIWTASEFNKKAIEKSGVTKPVYIIPEAIPYQDLDVKPYLTVNSKDFKFYSIFEWTERKNPLALLEAFWTEFKDEEVSLTIKTYLDNFKPEKRKEIENEISRLKSKLGLVKAPKLYLFTNLLDRHQIYRFHKTFDCFVSTHRGEGWGIPQMEAMIMEKPIISTNCGGIHDFLNKDVAYLLDCNLISLKENSRNKQWYTPDQKWADVKVDDVRKAMREVFNNQDKAKEVGKKARAFVLKNFEVTEVGKLMYDRLLKIEGAL